MAESAVDALVKALPPDGSLAEPTYCQPFFVTLSGGMAGASSALDKTKGFMDGGEVEESQVICDWEAEAGPEVTTLHPGSLSRRPFTGSLISAGRSGQFLVSLVFTAASGGQSEI